MVDVDLTSLYCPREGEGGLGCFAITHSAFIRPLNDHLGNLFEAKIGNMVKAYVNNEQNTIKERILFFVFNVIFNSLFPRFRHY